jgi:ribosome recycling factor
MIQDLKRTTEDKMKKSLASLKDAFSKIRTGRAHTSLLDHVRVPCYGQELPLRQVATVVASDARTLSVSLWDKNLVGPTEKALLAANLGVTPVTAGTTIRIPLPPLTQERRLELVKLVRQESEQARVSVRNLRREALNRLKQSLKDKEIGEDEERHGASLIQELTDAYIAQIDKELADKESELMEV